VVLGVVLATTLAPARAGAAALGAAGWLAALALRAPAGALVSRLPKQAAPTFMALVSGPAEESVRLLLVLFAVKDSAACFGPASAGPQSRWSTCW
jgi:hypothetical protein